MFFSRTQGINGQFSIPLTKLPLFQQIITTAHPSFSSITFNLGATYDEGEQKDAITTFKRLSVKVRKRILTDGLDDHCVDWQNYGEALPAEAWHKEVEELDDAASTASSTILLGNTPN